MPKVPSSEKYHCESKTCDDDRPARERQADVKGVRPKEDSLRADLAASPGLARSRPHLPGGGAAARGQGWSVPAASCAASPQRPTCWFTVMSASLTITWVA